MNLESLYDSDEGVAIGPPTVRELKRPNRFRIKRRHTINVKSYSTKKTQQCSPSNTVGLGVVQSDQGTIDQFYSFSTEKELNESNQNIQKLSSGENVCLNCEEAEENSWESISDTMSIKVDNLCDVVNEIQITTPNEMPEFDEFYSFSTEQELNESNANMKELISSENVCLNCEKTKEISWESISDKMSIKVDNLCDEVNEIEINTSNEMSEFNDTLEEMEMALKFGLDYQMSDDCSKSIDTSCTTPNNLSQSSTSSSKEHSIEKSRIPQRIDRQNRNNLFKMPEIPKSKIPTPKSFKNVLSPVGVYIRNSPKPILKRNVHPNTNNQLEIDGGGTFIKPKEPKENGELPKVIYKPAKKNFILPGKTLQLPKSIQKLVNLPVVTKHEKRIQQRENCNVSRKLMVDNNLTMDGVDPTLLDDSRLQDISILVNNQALIE